MTREEAIEIFSGIASLAKINTKPTMSVRNVKNEVFTEVLQALLVPQPAPITGLVPCGCGGKAVFDSAYGDDEVESSYTAEVYCELCEIRTPIFRENADVKAAWNRAMGWKGGLEVDDD